MKNRLYSFIQDEDAGVTVEFVMILPVFLAFFAFSFVSFDVLKNKATTVKASYTSGDLVSRRTTLDNDYLEQVQNVFKNITRSKSGDTWMRFTSITQGSDGIIVDWSYVAGESAQKGDALDSEASQWNTDLPNLVVGETVVYLETYRNFSPGLSVILFQMSPLMKTRVFTNKQIVPLRFTEQLINSDFPLAFSDNVHNDGHSDLD